MTNKAGRTPLHWACAAATPRLAVVEDLTEVDPGACGVRDQHGLGRTPLLVALGNAAASPEILHNLIASNPGAAALRSLRDLETPLHTAVARPDLTVAVMKDLVRAYPQALQMKDGRGRIPLHAALDAGAPSPICKGLVKKWPFSVEVRNEKGEIPHAAAKRLKLDKELIEFLYPYEDDEEEEHKAPK